MTDRRHVDAADDGADPPPGTALTSKDAAVDDEDLIREMAAAVDVGFAIRDVRQRRFRYLSPGLPKILGLDPAGPPLTFAMLMSLVHPDDVTAAAAATARVESGEKVIASLRMIGPDAAIRWIRFTASPVTNGQGVVVRVAATFEDVTDAKNADIAARVSEERFRRTANALQVGISLRQLRPPRFLYVNDAYVKVVGFDPTLADGAPIGPAMQRIHPDDRENVLAEYWRRAEIGESVQAEMRVVQPSGDIRWLRVTSNPVQTEPGSPALAAGTIEDITDRKSAEAELLSARRDAEAANRAKSDFLSRISHELRTPLNAVLGFAQLLELEATSETQLDAIKFILNGGRHLLEMINDLLDISRIETDQFELSTESIDTTELVSETIGLLGTVAATQQISIHFDPTQPGAGCMVTADRRRLRQVLLNLLSNAIKYNRPAGRVDIRCALIDEDHLALSMTDTGIGIASGNLQRLFSPFDRLGQQSGEIEGAGIGLALVQRLVTIMGGRLDVESTLGRGSTFTVVLPLAPSPAIAGEAGSADAAVPDGDTPPVPVLYIEDNVVNVELMTRILRRRPRLAVVHAVDAAAGLALARQIHPRLIFLDVHLPDMDGIDVLRALQADSSTADIPVVVVSANAGPGQLRRIRDAGAPDFLVKPLDVDAVLQVVDRLTSAIGLLGVGPSRRDGYRGRPSG